MVLKEVRIVEPNPDQVRALGKFVLDAWRRAGPKALGWTGATDDTIHEISSEESLMRLVSDPKLKFFVCEENGEIAGFAANRVQDASTIELAGIIVRDDLLGKGIGSILISKCVGSARDAGFASMVVKTEASNERAISFYVKRGFVRLGNAVETVDNSKVELATLKLVLC
ncbi:MAG: GNAT family N-acetyltransferase [Candidatus Bathyarchaeia archaeon]|jgi:ribosomal protein S18 acetylase RimI-like enzyme